MSRKRRRFGSSFKAKVAIEAIKEIRTISELGKKHKLHATQINLWKKQLLNGAESVFDSEGKEPTPSTDEPSTSELYEQIGRLKVQLEWFKKKVAENGE